MGDNSTYISPTETDLPAGTVISLADNTDLTAAGWALDVTADGRLKVTPPEDADGTVQIALTVTYPDGTTEPAIAQVAAIPAPWAEAGAGGSSLGSS